MCAPVQLINAGWRSSWISVCLLHRRVCLSQFMFAQLREADRTLFYLKESKESKPRSVPQRAAGWSLMACIPWRKKALSKCIAGHQVQARIMPPLQ
eukprot:4214253-Amphidinium_carterae.1